MAESRSRTDYNETTTILNAALRNPTELAGKGLIYRQVLSLLLSGRRPSYYLVSNREALAVLTNKYLRLLVRGRGDQPGPA